MNIWLIWGFALLVQAFICGGLSADLAEKKGYSQGIYFASGFFFGVLGLIATAGLPPSRLQAERDSLEFEKQARRQVVEDARRADGGARTTTELLSEIRAEQQRTREEDQDG